jgi:hypothetical protein
VSTAAQVKPIGYLSPRPRARIHGGVYFSTLLTAQLLETLFPDRMNLAAGLIEIVGMLSVTLMLYLLFKPVNRGLSLLAAVFNLAGITLEAIHLNAHGSDFAMVFHGVFCILVGYLIWRSAFLPRILGALMTFGGLAWLTYPLTPFADYLSRYNVICGLVGEASVFLWLLVMGVDAHRWHEQAITARSGQ